MIKRKIEKINFLPLVVNRARCDYDRVWEAATLSSSARLAFVQNWLNQFYFKVEPVELLILLVIQGKLRLMFQLNRSNLQVHPVERSTSSKVSSVLLLLLSNLGLGMTSSSSAWVFSWSTYYFRCPSWMSWSWKTDKALQFLIMCPFFSKISISTVDCVSWDLLPWRGVSWNTICLKYGWGACKLVL